MTQTRQRGTTRRRFLQSTAAVLAFTLANGVRGWIRGSRAVAFALDVPPGLNVYINRTEGAPELLDLTVRRGRKPVEVFRAVDPRTITSLDSAWVTARRITPPS